LRPSYPKIPSRFKSSTTARHHWSMDAGTGRPLLIFQAAPLFHLSPSATSTFTSPHSLTRPFAASFAAHWLISSPVLLVPLSGTIVTASGDLVCLPLVAQPITMWLTVSRSYLMHGPFLILRHAEHVYMSAQAGDPTYHYKSMLAGCQWLPYAPFA
jgi:hypothetical protein